MTKKDKILLSVSVVLLVAIVTLLIIFWDSVYSLLNKMNDGVDVVEEYIRSLGITGILVMVVLIMLLYFFPVISSVPIQVAAGIAYGILGGSLIVWVAVFLATQLLYLLRRDMRIFSTPNQIEKKRELERMIKESDRSIYVAVLIAYMLPAVPFLVISNLAASGLKYPKYTLVTALGMIPDILVTLFLGKKLLSSSPVTSVITLMAIIVIIILSIIFDDKLIRLAFATKKKTNDAETEQ